METLGKRIRYARKMAELTQQQLSDQSGVAQSDISKLERDEMKKSTGVVPLARALGCNPARDWSTFAAVTAAFSALHIGTAFAAGSLPSADLADGLLYYAGKGWIGPLFGMAYVGLHSAVLKPTRPGRTATRAAIAVGVLAYIAAAETRAIFGW